MTEFMSKNDTFRRHRAEWCPGALASFALSNWSNNREAAILLTQEFQLPIFPVTEQKTPIKNSNGWKDATTSEEQIDEWWPEDGDERDYYGLACVPGTWGAIVIDLDVKEGECPGVEWWLRKAGIMEIIDQERHPTTTPGGGWHLWYRAPNGYVGPLNRSVATADGQKVALDVRCDGGYVVIRNQGRVNHYTHYWYPEPLGSVPDFMQDVWGEGERQEKERKKRRMKANRAPEQIKLETYGISKEQIKPYITEEMLAREIGSPVYPNKMVHCPMPDHPDKKPSAQIATDGDGIAVWTCFKCCVGGDLMELYMLRDGITFQNALNKAKRLLDTNA